MNDNTLAPPGTESCGCCDGIAASTPTGLFNRGGLSAISYRIGDYAQFKESLQAGLSSSYFPKLADLRTRDADDYTLGLIDAVACVADVLTFYQERLANESYLRTATERVSLQEMAKLTGYRLRPGVAAETWLAFALETPPAAPASLPAEPGNFVTGVPTSLKLEVGLKVQSVPGPGEKPQTFETVEELAEARPEWNGMRPWLTDSIKPGRNDTFTYVAGLRNNLRAGDALLILGDEYIANRRNNNWDFRIIDSVEPQSDSDRTLVRWKLGLGSIRPYTKPAQNPQVLVLRKRAAVFGHNAPMWSNMSRQFRHGYPGGRDATNWPHFTLSPLGANSTSGGYVDLDAVAAEVSNDSYVVLAKGGFNCANEPAPTGTYVELYKVANVAEVSRAEFAFSGKVSRLLLTGDNYATQFQNYVRETAVFAQSEVLTLANYPVTTDVSGNRVPVNSGAKNLFPGRRLIIRGKRKSDNAAVTVQATLLAVHAVGSSRCELEISPPLADPLVRESLVVYGNVALASHGETVSQILGAGDASRSFQRFELKRLPLTYRSAGNETGADSELSVRIGDVEWTEKPTLFGAASIERAYALSVDEQGKTWVVFGDGLRGARLSSGVNNVRAKYRQGLGQEGNVGNDKLTQLMTRPLGLKSVSNPTAALGGTDAEPADQVRRTMPLGTRTLGRVVSLLDYEDFAMAFAGIAKAQAKVLQLTAGPTIAITVAGQDSVTLSNLLLALKANGDPHVNVALLSYKKSSFHLGLKVKRDPAYELKPLLAAIEAALRAHYGFDARTLGQPVLQSEVIAVVHSVAGVMAVDLDFLYTAPVAKTQPSRQTRLLASRMHVSGGVAMPAELLTLDAVPFDRLEEMP